MIIKQKHGIASENPSVAFILEAFRKPSVEASNLVDLKDEQKKAVNCLSEGRDVFADMLTGYGKRFVFQLSATAVKIKKVRDWQHSDTVVLVTCPLTSVIQDQVLLKERRLCCV